MRLMILEESPSKQKIEPVWNACDLAGELFPAKNSFFWGKNNAFVLYAYIQASSHLMS